MATTIPIRMIAALQTALDGLTTAVGLKANSSAMTTALSAKADASALASIISDWHPYNRTAGGSETGLIWSFAANGAVANVVTPDFADGFEYMIVVDLVRSTTPSGTFQIELYRETSAAYSAVGGLISSMSAASGITGQLEITMPRRSMRVHYVSTQLAFDASNATTMTAVQNTAVVAHSTAQKILRARLSISNGNINGSGSTGEIYLYRRKLTA